MKTKLIFASLALAALLLAPGATAVQTPADETIDEAWDLYRSLNPYPIDPELGACTPAFSIDLEPIGNVLSHSGKCY